MRDIEHLFHMLIRHLYVFFGFPGDSASKEFVGNAGDPGLIPGLGRSPGEGNGNPLQYSCLVNPMDRGALWAIVHGITEESGASEPLTLSLSRLLWRDV